MVLQNENGPQKASGAGWEMLLISKHNFFPTRTTNYVQDLKYLPTIFLSRNLMCYNLTIVSNSVHFKIEFRFFQIIFNNSYFFIETGVLVANKLFIYIFRSLFSRPLADKRNAYLNNRDFLGSENR